MSPPSADVSGWSCTAGFTARLGRLGTTRVATVPWLAPTLVALATVPTRPLVALVAVPAPVTVTIAPIPAPVATVTTAAIAPITVATPPVPVTVAAATVPGAAVVVTTTDFSSVWSPFPCIVYILKVRLISRYVFTKQRKVMLPSALQNPFHLVSMLVSDRRFTVLGFLRYMVIHG